MRIAIQADDGDEVSIAADFVSVEQAIVTLEIENGIYNSEREIETVTLTIDRARELARALLSVVEAIEFVSTPRDLLDRKLHSLSRGLESSIHSVQSSFAKLGHDHERSECFDVRESPRPVRVTFTTEAARTHALCRAAHFPLYPGS